MTHQKIIDYMIICDDFKVYREGNKGMPDFVKDAIQNGWQPLGGLCSIFPTGEYDYPWFYQAMVKYEETE